jgi:hypothetical protein
MADPFLIEPDSPSLLHDPDTRARSVFRGRLFLGFLVVLECLFLLPMAWAVSEWFTRFRLHQSGVDVVGRVTALEEDNGSEGEVYYTVHYEIEVDGKRLPGLAREASVTGSYFEKLKVGSAVPVRYLPESGVSRLVEDHEKLGMSIVVFLGFLVAAAIFLALFFVSARKVRLLRDGQILDGELLACRGELDSEKDYQLRATYKFVTPEGRSLEGKAEAERNDWKDRSLPASGTPVAVLYLNDDHFRML